MFEKLLLLLAARLLKCSRETLLLPLPSTHRTNSRLVTTNACVFIGINWSPAGIREVSSAFALLAAPGATAGRTLVCHQSSWSDTCFSPRYGVRLESPVQILNRHSVPVWFICYVRIQRRVPRVPVYGTRVLGSLQLFPFSGHSTSNF